MSDNSTREKLNFEEFSKAWEAGESRLIWSEFHSDLETPVSCYLKLASNEPYAFLLESVEGGNARARYSFVGIDPDVIWRADGGKAQIAFYGDDRMANEPPSQDLIWQDDERPILESLRDLHQQAQLEMPANLPPMAAGLVGYLGYDSIRLIENIADNNPDPLNLPMGMFIRPRVMLIYDNVMDRIILATPLFHPNKDRYNQQKLSAKQAWEMAHERLAKAQDRLANALPMAAYQGGLAPNSSEDEGEIIAQISPQDYMEMVARAKDYILAGDIFQVVLSQRFEAAFHQKPFEFYRALRQTNPAPFLFFLNFKGLAVAGSSPEILVRQRAGKVTIRPLAGTRPRGKDKAEDEALEQDLLNDPKECAEHLMLLDLGRNDAGRVAKMGSVKVQGEFLIERYSHVMHIVSEVEAELDDAKDSLDALFSGFPAGTVSGAPKVRAMEIIDELEPVKRGIYAGCVGYFAADGSMDSCIALRTAVMNDDKIYIQAGAGIVADSIPENEQKECEAKAQALIAALKRATNREKSNLI